MNKYIYTCLFVYVLYLFKCIYSHVCICVEVSTCVVCVRHGGGRGTARPEPSTLNPQPKFGFLTFRNLVCLWMFAHKMKKMLLFCLLLRTFWTTCFNKSVCGRKNNYKKQHVMFQNISQTNILKLIFAIENCTKKTKHFQKNKTMFNPFKHQKQKKKTEK